ncbi:DUF6766 family protein [Nocardioides sp. L-11A]|uniref:DUF6766 family protein n=1 Tax=Nocardioides sp. L-11A TaxID=3043848 RepID=UPI00249A2B25|nr:hypothetical protein QJ852_22015 [Nocardioides sp. L-11A]
MNSKHPGHPERKGIAEHVRRWGAVYLLLLLFVGSWAGQFLTQLAEFRSDQQLHGEPFVWSDYLVDFFASTFENWQSEWLQLIFQAILLLGAKHWIFRVDAEDMERLERKVDSIAERVGVDIDSSAEPEPERAESSSPGAAS